jgi:GPH family glycoside/pentoside/hexuronide:cation symporter
MCELARTDAMDPTPITTSTPTADRIPLKQKIAYSMGVVSDHYANVCLAWIFITPFFVDFLGIGASVVGLALAAARCWDAFTDPLVGRLSDACTSRYGRRKPFIFVGAILTGLLFPVIWMVPDAWSTTGTTIYLFVALMLFYSVYSIFSVPYEALGSELTPDYSERSKIFVVRKYVQEAFNLGIVWVFPFAAWLGTLAWVGGETGGVRVVSWFIAAIIIGAGILPAIFNVERYKDIAVKEGANSFKDAIKAVVRNKPLLIVVGVIGTYLFAIMATANLAYFVNVYYIYEGDILKGASLGGFDGTLRLCFALGAAAVIGKISDKVDKHKIMITSVVILIVAYIGVYFTTIPGRPWLALSMKPLVAIGECGFWVLILSMRADVCDWDEYRTGTRSEGLIAAITNWCNKIAMTLAIAISGFLLQYVVQFDSKLPDATKAAIAVQAEAEFLELTDAEKQTVEGEAPITLETYANNLERQAVLDKQSPGTMERMRVLYTLPQAFALLVCLFLLKRYPLTRETMHTIRAELESRRGKTSES